MLNSGVEVLRVVHVKHKLNITINNRTHGHIDKSVWGDWPEMVALSVNVHIMLRPLGTIIMRLIYHVAECRQKHITYHFNSLKSNVLLKLNYLVFFSASFTETRSINIHIRC